MAKQTKDSLGDRMKSNYENRSKTYLTRRSVSIIRCDGKSFHSFTRHFKKPYDECFHEAMNETMMYMCKNIMGCKLGYTQSDEITLVLTDYDTLTTEAWFDYGVQKMCSVAASMATMAFNKAFEKATRDFRRRVNNAFTCTDEEAKLCAAYEKAIDTGAMFDARVFSLPDEEAVNCLIWRQQDATRNAIQMLGQTHFSSKELHKKSQSDIQDMLMLQKGINFNDMPTEFKRGICCIRAHVPVEETPSVIANIADKPQMSAVKTRYQWKLDKEIPIFTQDRQYVTRALPKRP